jgi:hypothetical protein
VDEYPMLTRKAVSPEIGKAIVEWLQGSLVRK